MYGMPGERRSDRNPHPEDAGGVRNDRSVSEGGAKDGITVRRLSRSRASNSQIIWIESRIPGRIRNGPWKVGDGRGKAKGTVGIGAVPIKENQKGTGIRDRINRCLGQDPSGPT